MAICGRCSKIGKPEELDGHSCEDYEKYKEKKRKVRDMAIEIIVKRTGIEKVYFAMTI